MPEVEHVRIAREAYERWRRTPNREAYIHNEFGNATLAAYRAGREDAARDLEAKIVPGASAPVKSGGVVTAGSFRRWAAGIARGDQPRTLLPGEVQDDREAQR